MARLCVIPLESRFHLMYKMQKKDLKPVKICGLNDVDAVKAFAEGRGHFAGFVFVAKSARFVTAQYANILSGYLTEGQKTVALFSNHDVSYIQDVLSVFQPDFLQLHGDETPQQILTLKQKFNLPIIKAVGVGNIDDLQKSEKYWSIADYMLLDAKPIRGENVTGGHGRAFDWGLLKDFRQQNKAFAALRFFLAGGISMNNALSAINISGANFLDLSSGVESKKGVKDPLLISNFLSIF